MGRNIAIGMIYRGSFGKKLEPEQVKELPKYFSPDLFDYSRAGDGLMELKQDISNHEIGCLRSEIMSILMLNEETVKQTHSSSKGGMTVSELIDNTSDRESLINIAKKRTYYSFGTADISSVATLNGKREELVLETILFRISGGKFYPNDYSCNHEVVKQIERLLTIALANNRLRTLIIVYVHG